MGYYFIRLSCTKKNLTWKCENRKFSSVSLDIRFVDVSRLAFGQHGRNEKKNNKKKITMTFKRVDTCQRAMRNTGIIWARATNGAHNMNAISICKVLIKMRKEGDCSEFFSEIVFFFYWKRKLGKNIVLRITVECSTNFHTETTRFMWRNEVIADVGAAKIYLKTLPSLKLRPCLSVPVHEKYWVTNFFVSSDFGSNFFQS